MFDINAFDVDKSWCICNVMLIERTGEVSRRVGLGKVHVAAFTKDEGSFWRDITLARFVLTLGLPCSGCRKSHRVGGQPQILPNHTMSGGAEFHW